MNIHTLTRENIDNESFHNLCRLQELTHYAAPAKSLKRFKAAWVVEKDDNGNIVRLVTTHCV